MTRVFMSLAAAAGLLFATMPASSDYQLHNYGFGSGGTSNSTSTNYSLNGISGETSDAGNTSTSYKLRPGNNNAQQADTPPAPTFTNPGDYYNELHFAVNPGQNPSDATYAVAISSDNFATTEFIQPDNTVGSTFNISVFRSYSSWGGSAGQLVTGLDPTTTYEIKVTALEGNFTQTGFGPTASATTAAPSITFDMYTDSQASPPFSTSFGSLLPATVTTASDRIWIGLTTNAEAGAFVYVNSLNGGLRSSTAGYTIPSATADLASAGSGYGGQGGSATQTSGGPLSVSSPFNVSGTSVAGLTTTLQQIFSTPAEVTGGSGALTLKAKAAALTPAGGDYQDTLTLTAAGAF